MRLTIFNGSPRAKGSNTKILLEHFTNGFMTDKNNQFELAYLNRTNDTEKHVELFRHAEHVILAFPLYTDAMPGIVKHFIEALEPLCGKKENPAIGFIVQSGFPEPIHSRYVEKYLAKLTDRLGCKHTGTVIKGGVEGIQVKPAWMTRKLLQTMYQLGVDYSAAAKFNEEIIHKLASRDKIPKFALSIIKPMTKTRLMNFYWDSQLKKNNAFERRFARPYSE